ncbi:MAG: hypothetical protein ISS70_19075 [Phycisphaerae bacterium]|nr:hypothetical protein [Phycisphaerae bacterium]
MLLLALVVIGALFVVASGVWVAIALARVISIRHGRAGRSTVHQDLPDCD